MLEEGLAGGNVWMVVRYEQAADRRRTRIAALKQFVPLIAGLGQKHSLELLLQLRPFRAIVLCIEGVVGKAGKLAQICIELRLDRADRHVVAARTLVGAIEV